MNQIYRDFLWEIGTEELPPKHLQRYAASLAELCKKELVASQLSYADIEVFATPRRLALLIKQLAIKQQNHWIEKRGPALNKAYSATGEATPAALGFARSLNVDMEILQKVETANGAYLIHRYEVIGANTIDLLPSICRQITAKLEIAKFMRWGDGEIAFIRPVRWLTALFGDEVVPLQMFGKTADRITYGHRFHHPEAIILREACDYEKQLAAGKVIASFAERLATIKQQIQLLAAENNAVVAEDSSLLAEVCGLVEWPVALLASFDEQFLQLPREALVSAMKTHQKAFPLENQQGQLLPNFITVTNLASKKPEQVILGNERVMRARLADAKFFYETDCKHTLESLLERLKGVIFQAKLGDMFARTQRLANLAKVIAVMIGVDDKMAESSALLCKADLVTQMVSEFPELQGIMGYYYALHEKLPPDIAIAIRDHYLPKFSQDAVPGSLLSAVVALADRLDKLVGIFGIGQEPTGEKDPFALRRAALGVLRICIEMSLPVDLSLVLEAAIKNYQQLFDPINLIDKLQNFFAERLRAWYQEQGVSNDIFESVYSRKINSPYDFHRRIIAIQKFRLLPEAEVLTLANKRVNNLLAKEEISSAQLTIEPKFFQETAEKELAEILISKTAIVEPLYREANYMAVLAQLAELQRPIDNFFDNVMVMADDEKIRNNRLAILLHLRNLFLQVADISALQL